MELPVVGSWIRAASQRKARDALKHVASVVHMKIQARRSLVLGRLAASPTSAADRMLPWHRRARLRESRTLCGCHHCSDFAK